MRTRQRTLTGRDQAASAFGGILLKLCDSVGSPMAALVDAEGETVDYAGTHQPFDIRVAAAEWQLAIRALRGCPIPGWNDAHMMLVRGSRKSFSIAMLEEGYAIVVELSTHAFAISHRALGEAIRELCWEAGLEVPAAYLAVGNWTRVEVKTSPFSERKPDAVWFAGGWCPLELLGRYADADLGSGELGYRVRLVTGAEVNLVRERLGRWYAEDLPVFRM
ncbi:MAG: hypothetical protein R3B13_33220 [Polyangiaceae bacterium]